MTDRRELFRAAPIQRLAQRRVRRAKAIGNQIKQELALAPRQSFLTAFFPAFLSSLFSAFLSSLFSALFQPLLGRR